MMKQTENSSMQLISTSHQFESGVQYSPTGLCISVQRVDDNGTELDKYIYILMGTIDEEGTSIAITLSTLPIVILTQLAQVYAVKSFTYLNDSTSVKKYLSGEKKMCTLRRKNCTGWITIGRFAVSNCK